MRIIILTEQKGCDSVSYKPILGICICIAVYMHYVGIIVVHRSILCRCYLL